MPQSERERCIVEHLLTKVLGKVIVRHTSGRSAWFFDGNGDPHYLYREDGGAVWNPLADTTLGKGQAMEVWERAREMGIHVRLSSPYTGSLVWLAERWLSKENKWQMTKAPTGPRALCEAIFLVTGGHHVKGPSEPESRSETGTETVAGPSNEPQVADSTQAA